MSINNIHHVRFAPFIFVLFFLLPSHNLQLVWSHGSTSTEVINLTERIKAEPDNVELYLDRCSAYLKLKGWDEALIDCEIASKLAPEAEDFDFIRGVIFFEATWYTSADYYLNKSLEKHPNKSQVLMFRARNYVAMKMFEEACLDFDKLLATPRNINPDLCLEQAKAHLQNPKTGIDAAIQSLDAGLKRLGNIVSLQVEAIEMEVEHQRYDNALLRLDQILNEVTLKAPWLLKKAEILEKAERYEEAQQSYIAVIDAIEKLPASIRNRRINREKLARANEGIERIKKRMAEIPGEIPEEKKTTESPKEIVN